MTASGSSPIGYTVQDGTHPQGPSNRYDVVGPATAPVIYAHDERGNLTYDGVIYYRYDVLNKMYDKARK